MGNDFWTDVAKNFGGGIATAGQSMLPNKLQHMQGFNYDRFIDGETDIEDICFTLQPPSDIKRKAILKNVAKLTGNVPFVIQLESDEKGLLFILILTNDDFTAAAEMDDGILPLENGTHFNFESSRLESIRGKEFPGIVDAFWVIVGMQFAQWVIDVIHLLLFLCTIIAPWRFILACQMLLSSKNKWIEAENAKCIGMVEHAHAIYHRFETQLFQPMLNDMIKDDYIFHAENRADFGHINYQYYYQKWMNQINKYWDKTQQRLSDDGSNSWYNKAFEKRGNLEGEGGEEDDGNDGQSNDILLSRIDNRIKYKLYMYDKIIKECNKRLSKLDPIPATKILIEDFFQSQTIRLYLKILHATLNLFLMNRKISFAYHSILIEQISVENMKYEMQMERCHQLIHDAHAELVQGAEIQPGIDNTDDEKQVILSEIEGGLDDENKEEKLNTGIYEDKEVKKKKKGCCGLLSKDLSFTQMQVRYYFLKSFQDLIALLTILLIICTLYRAIPLMRDLYFVLKFKWDFFRLKSNQRKKVGPSLRFGLKQALALHVNGFVTDLWNVIQLLLFTVLIFGTLVRMFDYILALVDGRKIGEDRYFSLEIAVKIAKIEAGKIWDDFYTLFTLFFA